MRPGGGKAKGAQFERDVCKALSRWMSHGLREDLFWRSAMSGGRATVGLKGGKEHTAQCGDITATDPQGAGLTKYFIIECKNLKSGHLDALVYGYGLLYEIWKKLAEQAERLNKVPMLILKENARPILVGLSWVGATPLRMFNPLAVMRLKKIPGGSGSLELHSFEYMLECPPPEGLGRAGMGEGGTRVASRGRSLNLRQPGAKQGIPRVRLKRPIRGERWPHGVSDTGE